jgi:hypothetical protein
MMLLASSVSRMQDVVGDTPVDRTVVAMTWIGLFVIAAIILIGTFVTSPPTTPRGR